VLFLSMRGLPKEVVGARLFLNVEKVGRGFLSLSMGFAVVLVPSAFVALGSPLSGWGSLMGSVGWLSAILVASFYLFKSLYVPRSVWRKFGPPSRSLRPAGSHPGGGGDP
jgi:hypothetical protein